jgi:hypothetical protein
MITTFLAVGASNIREKIRRGFRSATTPSSASRHMSIAVLLEKLAPIDRPVTSPYTADDFAADDAVFVACGLTSRIMRLAMSLGISVTGSRSPRDGGRPFTCFDSQYR